MCPAQSKNSGQALIEYIFIFAFMGFLSVNLMKGLGSALSLSVDSLSYALTQELSVGVCPSGCFNWSYINQAEPKESKEP